MKWRSAFAVLLLAILGCGSSLKTDYGELGLVEIAGLVTLDGDPVEGAAVFFTAEDQTYCFGVTDSSGRYKMMLNSEKSGVTPGKKRVEISTIRNPLGDGAQSHDDVSDESKTEERSETGETSEKIPACYNSDSTLTVTITDSDSDLDFDLKSDGSTNSST